MKKKVGMKVPAFFMLRAQSCAPQLEYGPVRSCSAAHISKFVRGRCSYKYWIWMKRMEFLIVIKYEKSFNRDDRSVAADST